MPLTDLLQWLAGAGKTGTLRVTRGKVSKRIYFREGRIIACATDDPPELLGHFLVSRGKISEETLGLALVRQRASKQFLGEILVGMGALPPRDLTRALEAKTEETIYSLFEWENAEFHFGEEISDREAVLFPASLRVEEILLRGMQRYDEMKRIRTVFTDPGIVLRCTGRMPPPEVHHNRIASRIFALIDGERTVAEILLRSHGSSFLVTKFLFELFRSGLVVIDRVRGVNDEGVPAVSTPSTSEVRTAGAAAVSAAAAPEPAGTASAVAEAEPVTSPATTLAEDLESAGRLMGRGEYDVALEILDQASRANPADEALRKLVVEAEAAFVEKAYRHYLPASKVPVLHRSVSELASENLSSLDFFILSRVNGTWDVRSIVQITPTREVDALRALKRMRERGLIALRDPA